MKTEKEIRALLGIRKIKEIEKILSIKVRNGQILQGVRATLRWILED